jgi:hypothetical protein
MERKQTTKLLSDILERTRLSGIGSYWAKEVSVDPFTKDARRIDYMEFVPDGVTSVSCIEKGIFICYEIKSCKEDVYSGNGLSFIGEKNYIVTTMECYKSLMPDLRNGKLHHFIAENFPESSMYFGVLVAVPYGRKAEDEFEHQTEFNDSHRWELKSVVNCRQGLRKRSMTELMFCMLRSGRE